MEPVAMAKFALDPAATVPLNDFVAVRPVPSVTVMSNAYGLPAALAVMVPVMSPVVGINDNPAGSDPAETV